MRGACVYALHAALTAGAAVRPWGCPPPLCAEDEARWFFQQLAVGLAYFHSIGVDNRELNLNNKLLTGGVEGSSRPLLKINDFTYRWVGGWGVRAVWWWGVARRRLWWSR